jgi:hypothetical protein
LYDCWRGRDWSGPDITTVPLPVRLRRGGDRGPESERCEEYEEERPRPRASPRLMMTGLHHNPLDRSYRSRLATRSGGPRHSASRAVCGGPRRKHGGPFPSRFAC